MTRQVDPIGLAGLIHHFDLPVTLPDVRSYSGAVARRTEVIGGLRTEHYPAQYGCETVDEHLRFALRTEPLDLSVWSAAMEAMDPRVVEDWVRRQPGGSYARRAWYLFEKLTGRGLDLPDVKQGNYVDLADPQVQYTGYPRNSERHRVRHNLLGEIGYSPMIRRTAVLAAHEARNYAAQVSQLTSGADPVLFARAANYLYFNETRSSFAIEGEKPTEERAARFVAALEEAGRYPSMGEAELAGLQNLIVSDPRFAALGWRSSQIYVGRTRRDYSEDVRYVCPKPEDLASLMWGWARLAGLTSPAATGLTDPVVLAACASFGFVFLHPFEDGNGRLHRFLIHHVLAKHGYTPRGLIFPVSAVMLRRRVDYETALDTVASRVAQRVRYTLDEQNRMTVLGDSLPLYRYPDLTAAAEFLYECIAETVENDWPRELRFLHAFDDATKALDSIVELPDAKARLLIRLLMQSQGVLSAGRRELFSMLTDGEVLRIEERIQEIMRQAGL